MTTFLSVQFNTYNHKAFSDTVEPQELGGLFTMANSNSF